MRIRHRIAGLGLAPILLAQGLYVRRVTPRLPEPAGARAGDDGTGPALRLLIVGDSAAAGVGADSQEHALSGRLRAALAPHFRLHWRLVARTGNTTRDALAQLEAEPRAAFDAAVVSLGVNDATAGTAVARWLAQQARLADLLAGEFGIRRLFLSALPPMQRFPALPDPLAWYLGVRARALNDALRTRCAADPRCELVDPDFELDAAHVAADGFHPGPAAYAAWAARLAAAIRAWSLRPG